MAARPHPVAGASAWLRGLTVASLVLAGAMIWSAYPGDRALLGLIERLLILTETAVPATLALTLTRPRAVDHAVGAPHRPDIPVGIGGRNSMIDESPHRATPARGA